MACVTPAQARAIDAMIEKCSFEQVAARAAVELDELLAWCAEDLTFNHELARVAACRADEAFAEVMAELEWEWHA